LGHQNLGKIAVITRALYGLKSIGAAWRSMFAASLQELGFTSCIADPDVWLRPATKSDGLLYYEYVFVYVDDLLVLSIYPHVIMKTISQQYHLKEGSLERPKIYLGAEIKQFRHPDNPQHSMWSMSADQYVKDALVNLEFNLDRMGKRLPTKVTTPLTSGYRPEVDASPYLDYDFMTLYQQLIGSLRWSVELGRIDIHLPVALMAQQMAAPRVGYLNQVFHMFWYLKAHGRSKLVLDPAYPLIDDSYFAWTDWSEFYPNAIEPIPPNAPEPRGKLIMISCFADADHAGNLVTRCSHSGIIIFCNKAPIIWYSKRQNTVETSTFESEFVVARIAVELIESLRYKLRMFGVPLTGPANMFCDNNGVVANKKHNAIAYHKVREAVAQGTIRIAKEDTKTNLADILTKPLPGPRMKELLYHILY